MKTAFKKIIATILGWQVRRLTAKNNFKVVAIVGSIGKTSTKFAVANVLEKKFKVLYQAGNYNDIVFVPLVIFEQKAPNIFNPFAWLKIFVSNELKIHASYPYEILVLELGSDAPGQIGQFKKYLKPDIGIVTAITPEHMEFFKDLTAVAEEELSLVQFSRKAFINIDFCPAGAAEKTNEKIITYGLHNNADIRMTDIKFDEFSSSFKVEKEKKILLKADHDAVTEPQLYSVLAAIAVADGLGMDGHQIIEGIRTFQPVNGRMRRLRGVNDSIIIDDTYNASPEAMKAALHTLYRLKAPQKIAILGNMNELGDHSEAEHISIGELCDPKKLDLVITIGPDANRYLAASAKEKGCEVKSFDSPYEAGEYLKSIIKPGSIILAKGSQNRVFAEEAVKQILADQADVSLLVRQSDYWLNIKKRAFSR